MEYILKITEMDWYVYIYDDIFYSKPYLCSCFKKL